MRCILLSLVGVACWVNPLAYGQNSQSDRELYDQLQKVGVYFEPRGGFDLLDPKKDPRDGSTIAVFSPESDVLKAFVLLRKVKKLEGVSVDMGKSKHAQECLKLVLEIPNLKVLRLRTEVLTKEHFRRIASFEQLEELSLDYPGITDENIRELHALKNLKQLRVVHTELTPKALAALRNALPQTEDIYFGKELTLQALEISPTDDDLMKLRKKKYNVVIAELQSHSRMIRAGAYRTGGFGQIESVRRMKDAALDLNDPILTMKALADYVAVTEQAYRETESSMRAGVGRPEGFYLTHYYYLDAQVLQLKLKKQMEAK